MNESSKPYSALIRNVPLSGPASFYRQHKADIHQQMQRLGQQTLQANGGKLPNCADQK